MIILIFGPGQTMADTTTQTTSLISLFQTILSNVLPEVQMLFQKWSWSFAKKAVSWEVDDLVAMMSESPYKVIQGDIVYQVNPYIL